MLTSDQQQQLFQLLSHTPTIEAAYTLFRKIHQHVQALSAQNIYDSSDIPTNSTLPISALLASADRSQLDLFPQIPIQYQAKEWQRLFQQNGKMFGCLLARDQQGQEQLFYAFSGQLFGLWKIKGWVNPCFQAGDFWLNSLITQSTLHQIAYQLNGNSQCFHEEQSPDTLKAARKALSQRLTQEIHQSYEFCCANQQTSKLLSFMKTPMLGAGDCCAIKLLNACFQQGLTPIGLCEFWIGKEMKNENQLQSLSTFSLDPSFKYYTPCEKRCMPILKQLLL